MTGKQSKGWLGERYDAEAGLQYLNARYYDPELGMFIQPDWWEVTRAGVGTNRYGYAFGDPVNGMDPGGHTYCSPDGICFDDGGASIPGFDFDPVGRDIGTTAMMAMMAGSFVAVVAAIPAMTYLATYEGTVAATTIAAEGLAEVSGGLAVAGVAVTAGAKIVGSPQVTQGLAGLDHAASTVIQVIEEILKIGANNVKQVTFNRSITTATQGLVKDGRRPDAVIETTDGCFIFCEIWSPSQTRADMQDKAESMSSGISSGIGGATTQTSVQGITPGSGGSLGAFFNDLGNLLGL